MENCKVIAVTYQKTAAGKMTTIVNLGVGLANMGKRVLLIDADPQGSPMVFLGIKQLQRCPDSFPCSSYFVGCSALADTTCAGIASPGRSGE